MCKRQDVVVINLNKCKTMNTKDKTPIILEKTQWISSIFGKRAYEQGQITLKFEKTEERRKYVVMALPGMTYEEQKEESASADLVDAEFADFYNAVGRDKFIRIVNKNNNNRNAIRQIIESLSNKANF